MATIFKFTHIWYKRLSEGTVFISLTVLGLSAWVRFANGVDVLGPELVVGDIATILAGVSLALGILALVWMPKKFPASISLTAYTALWSMVAVLIFYSGGVSSPFITLWVITAIFAGVFSIFGLLPMVLVPVGYIAWRSLAGSITQSEIAVIVLAGELPLLLSFLTLLFRADTTRDPNRAYQQLATELSQVAGKAEVVINAITDGVIALNSQGNIQLINPAAQRLMGWVKHDAVTLNYKSVLKLTDSKGEELAPSVDPVLLALAANQEIKTDEFTLITNSGKKLLVSLIISPVGQPGSGVIVVFRDITKEKTEEHQQVEFISTASHEMRTPVAAIEGYLGLTLNPATAQIDAKAREYITKAHEAAEHLGRLFQDLLDVSRAEDGRLSNNPSVVDVVAFTHDVVQGLRPNAEAKGLRIIFKPQPDDESPMQSNSRRLNPVYYVNVDNDHLREVVSNLVENAIKYTREGTVVVDVGGDDDGEHVVISVEDSGIGVPAEDLPHLFQKFYRVDNSDTREIGGTGLGLYLSRRLTESMEGRIWAESRYGQGSTFSVELPRLSHEDAMTLIEGRSDEKRQAITVRPAPVIDTPSIALPPENPPAAPIVSSDESTYINPPAAVIAAQLTTATHAPRPAEISGNASQATLPAQPQRDENQNPTLSAIEQYPEQYLRRPGTVAVTPRKQNQP